MAYNQGSRLSSPRNPQVMQKNVSLILACAAAVLLAICIVQSFEISDQKASIATLNEAAAANRGQIKTLQGAVRRLETLRATYNKEIRNLSEQNSSLATQQKALTGATHRTNSGTTMKEGFSGMLAEMMKDPEMKKAMETQQKQMVKMMYAGLAKELKLSPEETDRLNQLLLDRQMQNMDKASELMSQNGDKAELAKEMKDRTEGTESQIKELLGDERFAQYKDYTQTMSDRMALDQFNKQFSDSPLSDQQHQQLLSIMVEERKNAGGPDLSKPENFNLLASGDSLQKFIDQQKTINQQVYARAVNILSAEQLHLFGSFQTNQLELQQMGLKMAQKMWGTNGNTSTHAH